jgi:hypothetical protein
MDSAAKFWMNLARQFQILNQSVNALTDHIRSRLALKKFC